MFSPNNSPSPEHNGFFHSDSTPDESSATAPENLGESTPNQRSIRYRGWLIATKLIDGKLWLRWQHPKESFPRYSYPVSERGLSETIRHVRFLIDLAIKLEQDAETQ